MSQDLYTITSIHQHDIATSHAAPANDLINKEALTMINSNPPSVVTTTTTRTTRLLKPPLPRVRQFPTQTEHLSFDTFIPVHRCKHLSHATTPIDDPDLDLYQIGLLIPLFINSHTLPSVLRYTPLTPNQAMELIQLNHLSPDKSMWQLFQKDDSDHETDDQNVNNRHPTSPTYMIHPLDNQPQGSDSILPFTHPHDGYDHNSEKFELYADDLVTLGPINNALHRHFLSYYLNVIKPYSPSTPFNHNIYHNINYEAIRDIELFCHNKRYQLVHLPSPSSLPLRYHPHRKNDKNRNHNNVTTINRNANNDIHPIEITMEMYQKYLLSSSGGDDDAHTSGQQNQRDPVTTTTTTYTLNIASRMAQPSISPSCSTSSSVETTPVIGGNRMRLSDQNPQVTIEDNNDIGITICISNQNTVMTATTIPHNAVLGLAFQPTDLNFDQGLPNSPINCPHDDRNNLPVQKGRIKIGRLKNGYESLYHRNGSVEFLTHFLSTTSRPRRHHRHQTSILDPHNLIQPNHNGEESTAIITTPSLIKHHINSSHHFDNILKNHANTNNSNPRNICHDLEFQLPPGFTIVGVLGQQDDNFPPNPSHNLKNNVDCDVGCISDYFSFSSDQEQNELETELNLNNEQFSLCSKNPLPSNTFLLSSSSSSLASYLSLSTPLPRIDKAEIIDMDTSENDFSTSSHQCSNQNPNNTTIPYCSPATECERIGQTISSPFDTPTTSSPDMENLNNVAFRINGSMETVEGSWVIGQSSMMGVGIPIRKMVDGLQEKIDCNTSINCTHDDFGVVLTFDSESMQSNLLDEQVTNRNHTHPTSLQFDLHKDSSAAPCGNLLDGSDNEGGEEDNGGNPDQNQTNPINAPPPTSKAVPRLSQPPQLAAFIVNLVDDKMPYPQQQQLPSDYHNIHNNNKNPTRIQTKNHHQNQRHANTTANSPKFYHGDRYYRHPTCFVSARTIQRSQYMNLPHHHCHRHPHSQHHYNQKFFAPLHCYENTKNATMIQPPLLSTSSISSQSFASKKHEVTAGHSDLNFSCNNAALTIKSSTLPSRQQGNQKKPTTARYGVGEVRNINPLSARLQSRRPNVHLRNCTTHHPSPVNPHIQQFLDGDNRDIDINRVNAPCTTQNHKKSSIHFTPTNTHHSLSGNRSLSNLSEASLTERNVVVYDNTTNQHFLVSPSPFADFIAQQFAQMHLSSPRHTTPSHTLSYPNNNELIGAYATPLTPEITSNPTLTCRTANTTPSHLIPLSTGLIDFTSQPCLSTTSTQQDKGGDVIDHGHPNTRIQYHSNDPLRSNIDQEYCFAPRAPNNITITNHSINQLNTQPNQATPLDCFDHNNQSNSSRPNEVEHHQWENKSIGSISSPHHQIMVQKRNLVFTNKPDMIPMLTKTSGNVTNISDDQDMYYFNEIFDKRGAIERDNIPSIDSLGRCKKTQNFSNAILIIPTVVSAKRNNNNIKIGNTLTVMRLNRKESVGRAHDGSSKMTDDPPHSSRQITKSSTQSNRTARQRGCSENFILFDFKPPPHSTALFGKIEPTIGTRLISHGTVNNTNIGFSQNIDCDKDHTVYQPSQPQTGHLSLAKLTHHPQKHRENDERFFIYESKGDKCETECCGISTQHSDANNLPTNIDSYTIEELNSTLSNIPQGVGISFYQCQNTAQNDKDLRNSSNEKIDNIIINSNTFTTNLNSPVATMGSIESHSNSVPRHIVASHHQNFNPQPPTDPSHGFQKSQNVPTPLFFSSSRSSAPPPKLPLMFAPGVQSSNSNNNPLVLSCHGRHNPMSFVYQMDINDNNLHDPILINHHADKYSTTTNLPRCIPATDHQRNNIVTLDNYFINPTSCSNLYPSHQSGSNQHVRPPKAPPISRNSSRRGFFQEEDRFDLTTLNDTGINPRNHHHPHPPTIFNSRPNYQGVPPQDPFSYIPPNLLFSDYNNHHEAQLSNHQEINNGSNSSIEWI